MHSHAWVAGERQGVWGVQHLPRGSLAQFRASLGAKDFSLVLSHLLTFSPLFDPHGKKNGSKCRAKVLSWDPNRAIVPYVQTLLLFFTSFYFPHFAREEGAITWFPEKKA